MGEVGKLRSRGAAAKRDRRVSFEVLANAHRVTSGGAELCEYSRAAFIGREPSTGSVGLSPQNFEPPILVNAQGV